MTVYQGTSFTPELTATGYALFRAGVRVSAGTCEDLAGSLRRRHERNGTRWRLLGPLAQAALVIAFLRTSPTYAELAAGFGISESTCWRDVREGISVLADRARRISLRDVARLAVKMGWEYVIVDGVHVPTVTFGRKTGGQRAFYSGKHKRHGLNVQTVCSPDGELLWAAAPLPGATVLALCTTWSTTRSLPCASRDPPQSLPIRDPHAACGTVAGRHAKITRDQQKEPKPSLSNQAAPCDNSG